MFEEVLRFETSYDFHLLQVQKEAKLYQEQSRSISFAIFDNTYIPPILNPNFALDITKSIPIIAVQ